MTARFTRRGFLGTAATFAGVSALAGYGGPARAAANLPDHITDGQVHMSRFCRKVFAVG